jgi:phage repressor protein C with HTH and peptisase S24 domain
MTKRDLIYTIRAQNLQNLIDERFNGNATNFAREAIKLPLDKKPTDIYLYLNKSRNISSKKAKEIEENLGLADGYLDQNRSSNQELEPGTFVIPEYSVKLAASSHNGAEVISPENIIRHHTLNDTFLIQYRVKPENLAVVSVTGHSMETTLRDGEKVVIDVSRREPIDNRVFAITTKNHCWVKRLRVTTNGERWRSDNEEYREFDDELNNGTSIVIDGLVLYSLGREIN